jgi:hypothetical protein
VKSAVTRLIFDEEQEASRNMRVGIFTVSFLILTIATSGFCQRTSLQEQVRPLFLREEGPPFPILATEVLKLGTDKQIAEVLTEFASTYRYAKKQSEEFLILRGAVASLGELKVNSADKLLASLLTDHKVHENIRAMSARSLAQIDPEGNRKFLLKALASTEPYLTRVYAAEGLANTKDSEALMVLERYSSDETDSYVRQKFEKAAESLRAKGVRPN